MKHVVWLGMCAVLLGAIAWHWAGAGSPSPSPPPPFQTIVDDVGKALLPPGGTSLNRTGVVLEPSKATAAWIIESDLPFEEFGAFARKSLTEYRASTEPDGSLGFSRSLPGDQVLIRIQRIPSPVRQWVQVTVIGLPD
jgi:hypothetical protein